MKKLINAVTAIIVTLSTFVLPLSSIKADGMVIKPDPYRWDYYAEETQQVMINYENGRQNMILSIGLKGMSDNLVWIFPVPSSPEKVVIDNSITQMPSLQGYEINGTAETTISQMNMVLNLNQIYPVFALPFFSYNYPDYYDMSMPSSLMGLENKSYAERDSVTVYEHIENGGIVTELITSDTAEVLQEYFNNKNLKVTSEELTSLSSYFGNEYCFVVSWLTSTRSYPTPYPMEPQPMLESQNGVMYDKTILEDSVDYYIPYPYYMRGLLVSFPTDQIYFPLIPTSVYGSKVVPAVIKIIGFVSPDTFKDIEPYTKTAYYKQDYASSLPASFMDSSKFEPSNGLKYTAITINAPSKLLTEDLTIKGYAPVGTYLASIINDYPLLFIAAPLVLNSLLASMLASLLAFKEARSLKIWKYSLIGLANIFTIISVTIVMIFIPTKSIKPEDTAVFDDLKTRGYSTLFFRQFDLRKFIFLPIFSALYIILNVLGSEILKWII